MIRNRVHSTLLGIFALAWLPHALAGMWDDPQNLQALPGDITPDQLRATMRSFAIATGARCSTCHVYENEADFSSYDFAADDKEKKRKAREMIRMVDEINTFLDNNLDRQGMDRLNVKCATCHHGVEKPQFLNVMIEQAYREGGIEAAINRYRELRAQYYGSYAYNFSPEELNFAAERLTASGDYDAALRLMDLTLEYDPGYARAFVLKATSRLAMGDREGARLDLLKALELEPDDAWTRQMLENLERAGPPNEN